MAEIHLDRFSKVRSIPQAVDLREFVKIQDPDWLMRFYRNTAIRNRDYRHSLYNIWRLANLTKKEGERYSYLVQERRPKEAIRVIGAATIILSGAVLSPDNDHDVIHAHDIDYVAAAGTSVTLHDAIGRALVHETVRLLNVASSETPASSDDTVPLIRFMATLNPADPNQSVGLAHLAGMEAIGGPAILRTADGRDYHQLDKGGLVPLQLYAGLIAV